MSSSGLCIFKDEVTELKEQLDNAESQRNPVKYKQLIQQVIFYMTKGIDMTPLFMTIVKAAATKDLLQKKLCYLYLCHYASSHADLALLTVNTLKRDAEDTNFMVRGLALRSMGSLRLANLVEYTKDAILKGLKDHSSYVRRAAVIGCLQLFKLAPQEINLESLIEEINRILTKDNDMQLRRNAMYVSQEIMLEEQEPSRLRRYVLKRLHRFDEWGMQFTLDVLMRGRPEKEEDIYSSLNSLDLCLKHANTSIVLSAIRVFLYYTAGLTDLRDDVFDRIKVPLLTALSSKSPEIAYSVVCHIEVILHQSPALFEDSISSLYCRYSDPVYLKIKKLTVLTKLVTESNGKQILDELSYYAQRSETASHSIHNIGMMALLHPAHSDLCIKKLFSFLEWRNDSIVSHALAALRDLVIKYDKYSALVPSVSKYLKLNLLPDGKASVVWMLGEFGENISEAPYVLEALIDDVDKEASPIVKLELLTASMKLFFKRPPECQALLGHLLEYCTEQEYNMDIRDRALLYYRLLQMDVKKARDVICCPRSAQFIDNTNIIKIDSKKSLLHEFNTLSVVYGQPFSAFSERQRSVRNQKRAKTRVCKHERKEGVEKLDKIDAKKIELKQPQSAKVPVVVDTNLIQIDEASSGLKDNSDSSKGSLALLRHDLSTSTENAPVEMDGFNQDVVSKHQPLLPIEDNLVAQDSDIDLRERTELQESGNFDKDLDAGNTLGENLISNNEISALREDKVLLHGYLGEAEESLGSEDNQILVEDTQDGALPSWKLVEAPDLSPEVFESLWRQLPETESYEIQLDEIPDQNDFLKLLANHKIYTMASTPPGAEQIRYFLYAQSDCYILCEVSLDSRTLIMKSTIKMEDPANVHSFIEVFQNCLVGVATS